MAHPLSTGTLILIASACSINIQARWLLNAWMIDSTGKTTSKTLKPIQVELHLVRFGINYRYCITSFDLKDIYLSITISNFNHMGF